MVANTAQANAALARTQGQLAATSKTAGKTGAMMKKALLGVGVAAGAAGVALFKIGEEFDDAYDKIRTRTGATGKEMVKLKRSFRDVVSDVPATFEDASTAVGDLNTRLGLSGRPLRQMSKQMLELSRITETDVEGNVKSVSRAFVDWEVKTKDQSKTLDGFFRLSQESGLAVSDIAESIQRFGSPLRQLGFDLEEAAAMFASFERAGVNTQTMIPGFKLAISNLTRPTEGLAESMKKLGIAAGDPEKGLRQVFDLMTSKGIPTAEKTGLAMDVFGKRAGSDMAEAIKQGRFELDDFIRVMKDGDGTILDSGRKTMDLAEHWQEFTNVLKVRLEPTAKRVFKGLGDLMKDVTKAFKQGGIERVIELLLDRLNEAIPKIIAAGGKIAGALLKGILNAGVWVQLAAGAFLVSKLGGFAAIQGTGKTIGQRLGRGMLIGWLIALPLLAKELHDWVRERREAIINAGIDFGEWFVNGLIDAVNLGIRAINDAMDDLNALAAFGVDAPEIGEIGKVDWGPFRENMQQGTEIVRATQQRWDNLWGKAKDSAGKNSIGAWHYWRDSLGKTRDRGERDAPAFFNVLRDAYQGISRSADKEGGDAFRYWRGWLDQTQDKGKTASNRFRGDVAGNFERLANASISAISVLASETNKTLSSLKVKDQVYVARKVKGGGQDPVLSQRGSIIQVPGTGAGDKVPALLEPGEVVVNRRAAAALGGAQKVHQLNKTIPRFAEGGIAGPFQTRADVLGSGPGFIPYMNYLNSLFGPLNVISGLRPGSITTSGNVSNHSWGGAVDISTPGGEGATSANPMGGSMGSRMDAAHRWIASKFAPINLDLLWRTLTGGNHYNHIHSGIDRSHSFNADAMRSFISRLPKGDAFGGMAKMLLKGPKGPLKEMGQAAIESVWGAANALMSEKTMTPGFGMKNLGNVHGESFMSSSYGPPWGGIQGTGVTATGVDLTSGPKAYGVAVDPNVISLGSKLRIGPNPFNYGGAFKAFDTGGAIQGNRIDFYDWRGRDEQLGWGMREVEVEALRKGGIVQKLAKGGKARGKGGGKGDPFSGGGAGGADQPALSYSLPDELAKKLKKLRALVAGLEEQIALAEMMDAFASSPAGSDLSFEERAGQIALNDQLLAALREFGGKLDKAVNKLPPGHSLRTRLQEELTAVAGPPYSQSKILAVIQNLDTLMHPDAVDAGVSDAELLAEMKVPLLQQQLEESRAVAFLLRSQMPTFQRIAGSVPQFADGGVVPGPVGAPVAAVVHGGETITPPGQTGPLSLHVYIGNEEIHNIARAEMRDEQGRLIRAAERTKIVAGRKTG